MSMLESALLMLHLLVAVAICGFVLLQHGKGADMGAAFGSGSSGSVFGSAGSANFLSRTTAVLATVFFLSSVGLTYYGTQHYRARTGGGVMDRATITEPAKSAPANVTPATAGDAKGTPAAPSAPVAPTGSPAAPSKSSEVPK